MRAEIQGRDVRMFESNWLSIMLAKDTLGGGVDVRVCVCSIGLLRLIEKGYRGESLWRGVLFIFREREGWEDAWRGML